MGNFYQTYVPQILTKLGSVCSPQRIFCENILDLLPRKWAFGDLLELEAAYEKAGG
jgi:hypothetical protein